MSVILETSRCVLRTFNHCDFGLISGLHSNPDIMHYIGQGVRREEQIRQNFENIIEHQDKYGFSAWAVFEKDTGTFIGRCGLVHIGTLIAIKQNYGEDIPVEVGYVLDKAYWGKGYATELAQSCLDYGFDKLWLKEIVAKTNKYNYSSQKVLQKIGMKFRKYITIEDKEGMYFSLLKEEYKLNKLSENLVHAQ